MTFSERIGGALVRPRALLSDGAAARHGVSDVAVLLALRVVAGETPLLARGVLGVPVLGPAALLRGVVQAVQSILPDLLGILLGGMLLGLLAGKRGAGRGREQEMAAYAWLPYLAVTLAKALLDTALQRLPSRAEELATTALALGWSALVWGIALVEARREAAPAAGGAS